MLSVSVILLLLSSLRVINNVLCCFGLVLFLKVNERFYFFKICFRLLNGYFVCIVRFLK